jgi:serine/threonine-protein kinase
MTIQDQVLASRYRILKNIGSGAFGVTFLAEDHNIPTQPKCVVKQLKPLVTDPNHLEQARKLFEKEAATLSKVGTHNQIPYLKDYFEEDEEFYLVQDFIDGTPLDQELILGQEWSEEAVLSLLQDCLPILEFIHSQTPPIIHRDLKPANLIRRKQDGKIILVDFGAVKESFQTKLIQSTVAIGTRGYMPTEQIRGKPRPASDIFALGMVAIQALTGVNPIDLPEDENGELVWQYIEDEEGQLQIRVVVSPGLAEILSKMICHDLKDRYRTAHEVIADLDKLEADSISDETSVILPEAFQGLTQPESPPERQSVTQPEAETVKQKSLIPETEPIEKQPTRQPQSSKMSPKQSSSLNQPSSKSSSPGSQKRSQNKIATWLESPMVKNFGIAGIILVVASLGMYGLNQHQTQQLKEKKQSQIDQFKGEVTSLFEARKYRDCLDRTNSSSSEEISEIEALKIEFYGKCSLALADALASAEQYPEALKLAEAIQSDSTAYDKAQAQIEDWSNQLVAQGINDYKNSGNLDNFDQIVNALSPSNPLRENAIEEKQTLEQLDQKHQALLSSAQIAVDNQQWQTARQKAQALQQSGNGYPYWEQQARVILQDIKEGLAAAQTRSQPTVNSNPSNTTVRTPQSSPRSQRNVTSRPSSPQPEPKAEPEPKPKPDPKPETTTSGEWDPCAEPSMFCTP